MTGASALPDAMRPELLRVKRVKWETADTFSVELDARARGGFSFEPGQFNMLYAFGAGESAISIAGDVAEPERLFHTVRAVGSVTRVLSRIKKGDMLGVRGPFGRGWPVREALGKDLLIVAGGIGLAPLRPVVLEALRRRSEFSSVSLIYGARTPADLLYAKELARWASRARVEVTVDRGDADWNGHTGVVTKFISGVVRSPATTIAMTCGPEVMMRFVARELVGLGVEESRIFVSTERNMKCGVALCGHCQLGPYLLCRDGPTFSYDRIGPLLRIPEL
jgi:NAD(P)H-flavin reductase